jgi:hypothetical protein
MPIMTFMTRFYHNFPLSLRAIPASDILLYLLRSALLATALFLVISCEEGPTKIGSELLPSNDFVTISSIDTISAWSYTMYNASIPTSSPGYGFVGDIYDPYFGTTTAGFVSQLRLSSAWKFGPVTVDSVRMKLNISNRGNNIDVPHILRLAEISDMLYIDSTYYSNTPTTTTGFEVTTQLPALKADTINNISFSLPISFGEYLIRDTTKLFYSPVLPDFRTYFKGLYMRLTPATDPLMMTFSLTSSASTTGTYSNYIILYMHDTAFVNRLYYFILDPVHPNAAYNKFERDFSTAEPDKKIAHVNDETYRDTLSYLQSLSGLYTKIVFPGLDSLKKKLSKSKFSINKARLFVPVYYDGDKYTVTTVPSSLRIRYTDNQTGLKHDIPDYNLDTNHKFYDGTLHKLDSTYYFNIATYIQLYFEDKQNQYKPEIEIYQGPTVLSSAILRTSTNRKPVKFEMTYTKF